VRKWSLSGVARLGLKRTTLFYKMNRSAIAPPADQREDGSLDQLFIGMLIFGV
jgi:hypothetical protein